MTAGRRRPNLWVKRIGSSTHRFVAQAATIVNTRIATRQPSPSSCPRANGRITIGGQCHRYIEYEISPSVCVGRQRMTGAGDRTPRGSPAQITSRVATTGTIAAVPGNGVLSSYVSPHQASVRKPAHESRALGVPRRTVALPMASASRAPAPNCQARAGVTKYAAGGFACVIHSE